MKKLLYLTFIVSAVFIFAANRESEAMGRSIAEAEFDSLRNAPSIDYDRLILLSAELGDSCLNIEDYEQALGYYRNGTDLALKMDSINDFVWLSSYIVSAYYTIQDYRNALLTSERTLAVLDSITHRHNENCMSLLKWRANLEYTLQMSAEAIATTEKMLWVAGELYGKDSELYYLAMNDYATALSTKDAIAALRIFEESLEHLDKLCEADNTSYLNACINLAQSYIDLGNYPAASKRLKGVVDKLDKLESKEVLMYSAMAHSKLGILSWYEKDFEECDRQMEMCTARFLEYFNGEKSINYYTAIHNWAVFLRSGKPEKALVLESEALEARKRLLGEETKDYIGSLNNMAWICNRLGKHDQAYDYAKEAVRLSRKVLGRNNIEYLQVMGNALDMATFAGEKDVDQWIPEYIPLFKSLSKQNFQSLSSKERPAYWSIINDEIDPIYRAASAYNHPEVMKAAYDASLFQKGVLLSTDVEIQRLISESNDADLKEAYAKIMSNNTALDNAVQINPDLRDAYIDSIQLDNKRMELFIQSKVLEYSDFTSVFDLSSKDVARALRQGEKAVEIIIIPSDPISLMALVLSPGNEVPQAVRLCSLYDLESVSGYDDVSRLIFSPLLPVLAPGETLYFSPSGILSVLPIEAFNIPGTDSVRVDDYWKFYRLSSTRELALGKKRKGANSAGIFGGMDFDMADNSRLKDYKPVKTSDGSLRDLRLAEDLNMRAGAEPLPQTKVEAEEISGLMKKKGVVPESYIGSSGTEEAFKNRSGRGDRILHLATHGFYWTTPDVPSALKDESGRTLSTEEISLSRSGLLFSGANRALMGTTSDDGTEDGILTAKEIADLNFHDVDLVVLSACETGLGDISAEGVFGLQRGFKKAGVNSLLMSLWKVDDNATRMLMVKFYEHYLSGKSKRESLSLARKYVREFEREVEEDLNAGLTPSQRRQMERRGESVAPKIVKKIERPYSDPKYWAAFILLDALD